MNNQTQTSAVSGELGIRFGALAPKIHSQVCEQFPAHTWPFDEFAFVQRCADAVTLLAVHGLLTDAEKARTHKRLMRRITEVVKQRIGQ